MNNLVHFDGTEVFKGHFEGKHLFLFTSLGGYSINIKTIFSDLLIKLVNRFFWF